MKTSFLEIAAAVIVMAGLSAILSVALYGIIFLLFEAVSKWCAA